MSNRAETIEEFIASLGNDRTLPLAHSALLRIVLDDYLDVDDPSDRELLHDQTNRDLYLELGKRAHQLVAGWSIAQRDVDPTLPLVLFDMDGVLYDYNSRVKQLLVQALGYDVKLDLARAMYIEDCLDLPKEIEVARSIQNAQGLFGSLDVVSGAILAWQTIGDAGNNRQICSAPLRSNPWCIKEKRRTLARDFGQHTADEAIIDREKFRHPGAILIEDNPKPLNLDKASWELVIFDRVYNQEAPTRFRIFGWSDPDLIRTLALAIHGQTGVPVKINPGNG